LVTIESTAPLATVHGYPRHGAALELPRAVEGYRRGRVTAGELRRVGRVLRAANWRALAEAGVDEVPTGDFSFHDHVLDTAVMLGAIPRRHRLLRRDSTRGYFTMARGAGDIAPLAHASWFGTGYRHLVPELGPDTAFRADSAGQTAAFLEATALGHTARPVLLGPVTFLLLAGPSPEAGPGFRPLALLDRLLPVYARVLADLRDAGARWVQLDEPALARDRTPAELDAAARAYHDLGGRTHRPGLLVASYFDRLGAALPVLASAPVEGLALDFTGPAAADLAALEALGGLPGKRLVAGVVDGRNVWANDLAASLTTLERLRDLAAHVDVATSCSLLHVPLDTASERQLPPHTARLLAFARQKAAEVATLARALAHGRDAVEAELAANRAVLTFRQVVPTAPVPDDPAVRARPAARAATERHRPRPDVRPARPGTAGAGRSADAEERLTAAIDAVIARHDEAAGAVRAVGEARYDDAVAYLAEHLTGFLTTRDGWVQCCGTHYVRPPILAGKVAYAEPPAEDRAARPRALTGEPRPAVLVGPFSLLARSFVRDDRPPGETASQVALALRDLAGASQAAGAEAVRIDEPALPDALPGRAEARAACLAWATAAFRLATGGLDATTRVHTRLGAARPHEAAAVADRLGADAVGVDRCPSAPHAPHAQDAQEAHEAIELLRRGFATLPAGRLLDQRGSRGTGWPDQLTALENLLTAAGEVPSGLLTANP
jgi:5-methyltetrahydropteroyltriglutamate--homocysteine methyltransferase